MKIAGILKRILIDLFLFALLFLLPWWLWLIFAAVSVFIIDRQYEIIVLGFIADAAYGAPSSNFFGSMGKSTQNLFLADGFEFRFIFIIGTFVLLVTSMILKPRLRFYNKM